MKSGYYIISIFILLWMNNLQGQIDLSAWPGDVLEKANTAKNAGYLSEQEKRVVFYTNLARYDGQLFAETILDKYLGQEKSTRFTRSLYRDLKDVSGLPFLHPEEDLTAIAKEHATISGKKGTVGHQRFEKRFNPLMGKYKEVAENCAYGYSEAEDIVIRLLIDEGIQDLGHRKNLLNPNFDSVGVSIEKHKKFRVNCVMDFGALSSPRP